MTNQDADRATTDMPQFTGGDVVRFFAAAYLPLVRSLHQAGAIQPERFADRISDRVGAERDTPWGALALSLAQVLMQDAANRTAR